FADGISIGDDGRLYVVRDGGVSIGGSTYKLLTYSRNSSAIGFDLSSPESAYVIGSSTGETGLDAVWSMPGFGLQGVFSVASGEVDPKFHFYRESTPHYHQGLVVSPAP